MRLRRIARAALAFAAAVLVGASAASVNERCLTPTDAPAADARIAPHAHSMDMDGAPPPAPTPHHDMTGTTVCMLSMACSPAAIALPSGISVATVAATSVPAADARSPSTVAAAPEPPPPRA